MTKERQIRRIGEFIQRQISRRQASQQPEAILLFHWNGGHHRQQLDSMKLSDIDLAYLETTASELYAIAEDDAIGLGDDPQKYVILSFNYDWEPIGRCLFDVVVPVPQEQTEVID